MPKSRSNPIAMLVTYRPKPGKQEELPGPEALARLARGRPRHPGPGPNLEGDRQAQRRGSIVEMFQWKDADASGIAHRTPKVMAIWEPMGPILEELKLASLDPVS